MRQFIEIIKRQIHAIFFSIFDYVDFIEVITDENYLKERIKKNVDYDLFSYQSSNIFLITINFSLSISELKTFQLFKWFKRYNFWCDSSNKYKKMAGKKSKFGPLIGSIDEGTSSARFILFRAESIEVICYHQIEIEQKFPQEGWVEQSPNAILSTVQECVEKTIEKLIALGGQPEVSFQLSSFFLQTWT